MRNNFKDLESYETKGFEGPADRIGKDLENNIGLISHVGNVIELYLPKIFHVFVSATGGDADKLDFQSGKAPDQLKDHIGPGRGT